jgi:2-desacetyl-2-hydroxyethyl bacteriochlorophyllide A dehydrogenase
MLQIVLEHPGRFAQRDVAEPSPAKGHALVRVHRIGVCGTDLHAFAGRQPFFDYPRVLGHELGVEVVSVDENDQGLAVGDRCSVEPYLNCGVCSACQRGRTNCCRTLRVLGVHVDGGMGPLLAVPVEKLHRSETLAPDQLALVETLSIGAHAIERAAPEPGENVLVIGAGPIGLGAIPFAQQSAARVIVMDVRQPRLRFCQERLGVADVVDPTGADPIRRLADLCGGELPTVVLDATGSPDSMRQTFHFAEHGGLIVLVGLFIGELAFDDPNFHRRELTLLASRNSTGDVFRKIIAQMESGVLDTSPWITHRLRLADVPERFAELPTQPDLVKAMVEV